MEADERTRTYMKESKRLVIEIPEMLHHEIKVKMAQRNCTMRAWVVQAIQEKLTREKEVQSS